jgi:pimeloyl-ACP methyl ester carboxylesterase
MLLGIHDETLFVTQLELLLWHVGWRTADGSASAPFTLVGYSLGGAIAAAYSALYPQLVRRLILIAPAGLMDAIPLIGQVGMFSSCRNLYRVTLS